MTLTKDHIIESLSNHLDLPKRESAAFLQSMFETIKKTLENGEDVLISGFGKFIVATRPHQRGFAQKRPFGWQPADCIPYLPWSVDNWRYDSRPQHIFLS